MPAKGSGWERTRMIHKVNARRRNDPCWICGEAIDWAAEARTPRSYSADHHTPTSLGGDDSLTNLRVSHYGCNASRGNTSRGLFPTSRKW